MKEIHWAGAETRIDQVGGWRSFWSSVKLLKFISHLKIRRQTQKYKGFVRIKVQVFGHNCHYPRRSISKTLFIIKQTLTYNNIIFWLTNNVCPFLPLLFSWRFLIWSILSCQYGFDIATVIFIFLLLTLY